MTQSMAHQTELALPTPEYKVRLDESWIDTLPTDLYIPPDAFEILLERFEGPLDFLLYLVKKSGVNLLDFDIAPIASQYIEYIESLHYQDIELASDYLVMASLLADLKSRLLLPKPEKVDNIEDDPRQRLIERLEEYAKVKGYADELNQREILERDVFQVTTSLPENLGDYQTVTHEVYEVDLLFKALQRLLAKAPKRTHHIQSDVVSLDSRMSDLRHRIKLRDKPLPFFEFINPEQGRVGIVVSFVAVLELLRLNEVIIETGDNDEILCIYASGQGTLVNF